MERFHPNLLLERCPKCGGQQEQHAVTLGTEPPAFHRPVLLVACYRCGAPLGAFLPMDANPGGYGASPDLE